MSYGSIYHFLWGYTNCFEKPIERFAHSARSQRHHISVLSTIMEYRLKSIRPIHPCWSYNTADCHVCIVGVILEEHTIAGMRNRGILETIKLPRPQWLCGSVTIRLNKTNIFEVFNDISFLFTVNIHTPMTNMLEWQTCRVGHSRHFQRITPRDTKIEKAILKEKSP